MIRAIYLFFVGLILVFSLYVFNINLENTLKKVEWFKIERVEIHGLVHYDPQKLVEELGLTRHDSLLRINRKKIVEKIEKNPRLKVMAIQPEYPHGLKIKVKELGGLFLMKTGSSLYEISEEANVIGRDQEILDLDKPVIQFAFDLSLDEALNDIRLKKVLLHWESLPPNEKNFIDLISEIVLDTEIKIYLRHEKSRILLSSLGGLEQWRKVHYGLLFAQENNIDFKAMDLRGELARFSLN